MVPEFDLRFRALVGGRSQDSKSNGMIRAKIAVTSAIARREAPIYGDNGITTIEPKYCERVCMQRV